MDDKVDLVPHSLVFQEGLAAKKLFLVKTGEVLCLKSSKDRLIPVFLAKTGDIIGENAMIDGLDYTYSAITLSHAELVEVSAESFKDVFEKAPTWLTELTTTMISRYQTSANLLAENRKVHPSIISEDQFTSELEIEFKRLLSKTE